MLQKISGIRAEISEEAEKMRQNRREHAQIQGLFCFSHSDLLKQTIQEKPRSEEILQDFKRQEDGRNDPVQKKNIDP